MGPQSRTTVRLAASGVILVALSHPAPAQEARQLRKSHTQIQFGSDPIMGEFTVIQTSDGASPDVKRVLYQDGEGTLLVLRYNTVFSLNQGDGMPLVSATTISVKKSDSGEILTLTLASGTVTLTYGAASVSTPDSNSYSAQTTQAALAMIATASQGFRDALRRLSVMGSYNVPDFESIALPMRLAFFSDVHPSGEPDDLTTDPTGVVENFSAATTPPGTFEAPFGQDYYQ